MRKCLSLIVLNILGSFMSGTGFSKVLSFDNAHQISFEDIPKNKYRIFDQNRQVEVKVQKSSTLLLLPFKLPETISSVKIHYSLNGVFKYPKWDQLDDKRFDDFPLRVNLLKHGKAPMVPFFAPAWVKAIRDYMKHPSDEMHSIVPTSDNALLTKWESPYSDSIVHFGVLPKSIGKGKYEVNYRIPKPLKISGIIVFADGDDTKQSFATTVHKLEIN